MDAITLCNRMRNIELIKLLIDNNANVNGVTFEPEPSILNAWEIANNNNDSELLSYLESMGAEKFVIKQEIGQKN